MCLMIHYSYVCMCVCTLSVGMFDKLVNPVNLILHKIVKH